jgi:hypothetical protein
VGDEVIPEAGLAAGETMQVFERLVDLGDGVQVWLRRWVDGDGDGGRHYLDAGRWCASRGGTPRLYAREEGLLGHAWAYRAPQAFDTWQAALAAAREAERHDPQLGRARAALAALRAS